MVGFPRLEVRIRVLAHCTAVTAICIKQRKVSHELERLVQVTRNRTDLVLLRQLLTDDVARPFDDRPPYLDLGWESRQQERERQEIVLDLGGGDSSRSTSVRPNKQWLSAARSRELLS